MKKLISFFLSIVMLFSITTSVDLSAYATTSGDFNYTVSRGGRATITRYNGTATSVTIPSEIDGLLVTSIGERAFYECTRLTSVTIPNSVTSIGEYAFHYCTSLTSVTIPNSVTMIGRQAFCYCTSLTNVTIPNSVTSIGDWAFSDCTSLTSITIPNSVTSIDDSAFYLVNNIEYHGSASGSPWGAKSINGYVEGYLVYKDSTKKELLGCSAQATSITIPNSVTSISYCAFYECTSLTSVTIPDSVTGIGSDAFYNCTSLTSVTIPDSVTSIGSDAFYKVNNILYNGSASGSPWGAKNVNGYVDGYLIYRDSTKKELLGCSAQATSVTIGDSVTSIGSEAFYYCTSLTSVTIPNSVTSIGSEAFYHCTSLTSVIIGNSVTSIGDYAFAWCSSITSVTIPNSVTMIGYEAFYHCTSLTSVIIGNSVTSIGERAFYECTRLTSVTIPNSVTSIGEYAFHYCTSLTSVTIPNSVTSIGEYAFYYCTSLTSVTIPNSVTSISEGAFSNCTSLTSVTIPDCVTSIGDWAFYMVNNIEYTGSVSGSPWGAKSVNGYVDGYLVYKDSTKKELLGCSAQATSVTIPNSVTSIGEYAFYYCTSLTSVIIGNSVTSIGDWAFYNCTNLTSVTIPNSVTSIGDDAFYNCTSLTSVTIGDSVRRVGSEAFYNCTSLTSVTIPDSVTSIGKYAFEDCTSLTNITVSSGNPNYLSDDGVLFNKDKTELIQYPVGNTRTGYNIPFSVTSIGSEAFSDCTSLTSVTIPNSVTSIGKYAFEDCTSLTSVTIGDSVTSIGDYAFYNCTSLTSVTIPNSVTSIGVSAFYNCTSLTSVTIPNSVTSIGVSAFYECTSLTSITIPNSVTSIGVSAFRYCTSLTSITIPNSVTSINNGAFEYCSSLIDVYYIGSETQWKNISIDSHNDVLLKANIHYINDGTSCEHSWSEWIYNGDAVYVSSTEYTDGTATRTCTECGETETKTIEGTGLLRARTATCEFASEVRAMIGVKTEQTKLFSNVYCKFTREDGNEIIVNSDKSTLSQDKTTAYYPFAITPQSLHSDIKVQFYAVTNDGITVWGQEYTYNMANNYIVPQLNKSTDTNWKTLLVELMYYGYENQVQANWKLDQPLTDLLTAEKKALHSTEALTLNRYQNTAYVTCENPETTWRAVNAEFGATTNIVFRTRALTVTDDLKAVVVVDGEAEPYTYHYNDPEDAECFIDDGAGGIYFKFIDLPASRLRSKVYVTLYKGDTPIINTFEYSAETYCLNQQGKGTQLERITDQLMRYANAARAYFGI